MADSEIPLPPPTFEFLVFSLKMQAEMRLGLLKLGEGMDDEVNLPAARHTIDMLAMIAEKTKGNLSLDEQRLIDEVRATATEHLGASAVTRATEAGALLDYRQLDQLVANA